MDEIFQLVFFLLIAAGWIIKAIADQKKRKEAQSRHSEPAETEGPRPPVPHAPGHAQRPSRPPLPPPVPPVPTVPTRTSSAPPSADRWADRAPVSTWQDRHAGTARDAGGMMQSRMSRSRAADEPAQGAGSVRTSARRLRAIRRLTGGCDIAPGRELTRAGVLWTEILGPARAVSGPHRSPAARRRDARR